ncbi:MAG: hypothetical protein ACRC50_03800 [Gaiella sp.]
MSSALRRALARAESLVGTRRGAGLLFAVALATYGLVSLAMPLVEGRDVGTYLRYYAQLFDAEPALPMSMLFRTPVAPLVLGGSLDLWGPVGTQVLLAVLYALSIVAWTAVAASFGRRAAVFVALALLVFPGWAIFFHTIGSDPIFAVAFSGWALLLARAFLQPSTGRFALVGLGIGGLALVRPGNQALLVLALVPLLLVAAPWRDRLLRAGALLACGLAVIGLWSVHNGIRYHDVALARGGNAFFPFYRAFAIDRIVRPANGEASRELARLVERDLLPLEPYRSFRIDLDTFFADATPRLWEDAVTLTDRTQGWDTDYRLLRRVGLEAVRAEPGTYAWGVLSTIGRELWTVMTYEPGVASNVPPGPTGAGNAVSTRPPPGLPTPSEGEPIPAPREGFFTTTHDGSIRTIWTSALANRVVSTDPGFPARQRAMDLTDGRLRQGIPAYQGVDVLRELLNLASRAYPRPVVWLVVGLVAVLWRRPRHLGLALTLAGTGLWVALVNALGIYAILEFVLPTVPGLIVLTAAGLVGEQRRVGGPTI